MEIKQSTPWGCIKMLLDLVNKHRIMLNDIIGSTILTALEGGPQRELIEPQKKLERPQRGLGGNIVHRSL